MSRSSARVTHFRAFTRYAPPPGVWLPRAAGSRWGMLLAFLLAPSTAHAVVALIAP
jgi:hypothetical protein